MFGVETAARRTLEKKKAFGTSRSAASTSDKMRPSLFGDMERWDGPRDLQRWNAKPWTVFGLEMQPCSGVRCHVLLCPRCAILILAFMSFHDFILTFFLLVLPLCYSSSSVTVGCRCGCHCCSCKGLIPKHLAYSVFPW